MKARAPSAMKPACWSNSSKKLPSRGNSLRNSMSVSLPGSPAEARTRPDRAEVVSDGHYRTTGQFTCRHALLGCRSGQARFSVRIEELAPALEGRQPLQQRVEVAVAL